MKNLFITQSEETIFTFTIVFLNIKKEEQATEVQIQSRNLASAMMKVMQQWNEVYGFDVVSVTVK